MFGTLVFEFKENMQTLIPHSFTPQSFPLHS